jgi:polyhydroxyalkanoate synthesis repressor PhaR
VSESQDSSEAKDRNTILISRYSSRRLYNTQTSSYITLDDITDLLCQGYDIQVLDKKTGDDLTRQILLQIITEHEARGDNVLPLNVLTDIVRSYGDKAQSFIPGFLAESFSAIKARQAELFKSLQQQMPGKLDPQKPMEVIGALQKTQAGILKSLMEPWMPKPAEASTATPDAGQQSADEDDQAPDQTSRDEELDQVKKQLEQLQEKLNKL